MHLSDAPLVSGIALGVWVFLYLAYPLAASGRTFGMAVLGVRAVRVDGSDLDGRHAVIRVLALPLSFLLLRLRVRPDPAPPRPSRPPRPHRPDAVVYAWDARAARLRFLARR